MRFAPSLIVCFCGAVLVSCGTTANKESRVVPVVRVVVDSWPGLLPYYVATEKGLDKEEGISLSITLNDSPTLRHAALASGEADLVGITLDSVVLGRAQGVPMTAVGQSDYSSGGDGIIADKSITSVAGLKGKRIAYPKGQPSEFFLMYVLGRQGLGPGDIVPYFVEDPALAGQAFAARRVDAAVTWDPWINQAEKLTEGKGHVLVSTRDTPGTLLGVVAANSNLLSQRKDRIVRSQKAWLKAVAYCRQHPGEANSIMAKALNVPLLDFERMAAGAHIADLSEELTTFGTSANPGPIVQLAKDANAVWLRSGVIAKAVDPLSVIDWSIVDELRKVTK